MVTGGPPVFKTLGNLRKEMIKRSSPFHPLMNGLINGYFSIPTVPLILFKTSGKNR
jgi:hypothetical protein